MKRIFKHILLLSFLFGMESCFKDTSDITSNKDNKEKSVTLKVAIPYAASQGSTRSIGEAQENTIETLDILAFKVENGVETFQYWSEAKKDAGNSEGAFSQAFSAKLFVEDYQQRFVLVTNARNKVEDLILQADWGNADKEAMLKQLEVNLNTSDRWNAISASNYTAIPMWGQSEPKLIKGNTATIGTISLLRMIAKVDVQLDENIAGLTSKFKIKSVHVYNTNTSGRVVPKSGAEYVDANMIAKKASLPDYVSSASAPLKYVDFTSPGEEDIAMRGAIYLFETAAKNAGNFLEETCIVVGGLYGSDIQETYYRLDFFASDETTHLDILRNHRYICNIVAVKGRGYTTVDEAYKAKSFNMVANILFWEENASNAVFDGHYMLSVSKDEFEFFRDAVDREKSNNVLHVLTDYYTTDLNAVSGWYVDKIVDYASGNPVTWLNVTPDNGSAGNRTKAVLTYEYNDTGADRKAVIWIAAGRMRLAVSVTQSKHPPISLDIVDTEDRQPIQELLFTSLVGVRPAAQQFEIDWEPETFPLTVNVATLDGKVAFDPTSGAPTTGTLNGNGTHIYTVHPQALTQPEINTNPFFEKASMYTFVVSNGPSIEAKTIFLRQIHYNLVATPEQSYLLDGSQYTLNVRSNAEWRIKSIVQTSSDPSREFLNLATGDKLFVGSTGGYNTDAGDPVTFTVVDGERSLWGKMDIVFESTETPKLFEDKTITLMFALPRVRIVDFGSDDNYNLRTTANTYNAGSMLSRSVNFGLDEQNSTVYSRGFDFTHYANNSDITAANINSADIVVVTFPSGANDTQARVLADYVLSGGVLIFMSESNTSSMQNELFRRIFPGSNITIIETNNRDDVVLKLADNVDDMVINGPFGDLRGLHVGTDAAGDRKIDLTTMPAGSYTLYANYADYSPVPVINYANQSAILRLNDYAMIHICDGGFLGSQNNNTSTYYRPFLIDSNGKPAWKNYGRSTNKYPIYNSALFANIMAWAISQTGNK